MSVSRCLSVLSLSLPFSFPLSAIGLSLLFLSLPRFSFFLSLSHSLSLLPFALCSSFLLLLLAFSLRVPATLQSVSCDGAEAMSYPCRSDTQLRAPTPLLSLSIFISLCSLSLSLSYIHLLESSLFFPPTPLVPAHYLLYKSPIKARRMVGGQR